MLQEVYPAGNRLSRRPSSHPGWLCGTKAWHRLGHAQIDFDDVTIVTRCLFRLSILSFVVKFDGIRGAFIAFMIRRRRGWIAEGMPIGLNDALLITIPSRCSDWRDKVFGSLWRNKAVLATSWVEF